MDTTSGQEHVLRGEGVPPSVPHVSLARFVIDEIRAYQNRVAQIHAVTGEILTYSDILVKTFSVVEYLRGRGIRPGDVISVTSENSLDFFIPILATLCLGATCATLNHSYTERELKHALGISKPCMIFCSQPMVKRIDNVAREVGFIKEVVVFGPGPRSFSRLLTNKNPGIDIIDEGPDSVVAILCSSGTTGLAKGVMLTGRNIITVILMMRDSGFTTLNADTVTLALIPFFHAYGFITTLLSMYVGMKVIVMPKFEEELFLKSIQNYKVTNLTLVPPLLVFLAKHPMVSKYDLSSVKQIGCGAAPLSQDIQEEVTNRFGIDQVRQGYGMTETTLGVLFSPMGSNKYGSSGKLFPGMLCKVLDLQTGKPVGPSVRGELCFKGPLIMKGYCGDLQATSACTDEDGFLHTGDVGYYDEEHFFYIVDRLKELIKYKGFQVPPAELEALLLTHPGIRDAAVIGVPDEMAGELPLAFVVKQSGVQLTEQDVIKFVHDQVSPQKRLHGGVRFINVIPKNPSGKILRRELRDMVVKSKL